ncbi:hypothetical protein MMC14_007470 [Varicellaria rhodocarpa]|nr:hypothetical protein [Varicellaria rhodocarpa]
MSSKPEPKSFESLPGEIRNQIYGHLLLSRHMEIKDEKRPIFGRYPPKIFKTFGFHSAILQTNKVINREAGSFLDYDDPFITVSIPIPLLPLLDAVSSFPTISCKDIRRFPYAALHCAVTPSRKFAPVWPMINDDPYKQVYHEHSVNIIILADDFIKLLPMLEAKMHTENFGLYLQVELCINQAFKNNVDCSRIMDLTVAYFVDLIETGLLQIEIVREAGSWAFLKRPLCCPWSSLSFISLWEDELSQMFLAALQSSTTSAPYIIWKRSAGPALQTKIMGPHVVHKPLTTSKLASFHL